MTALQKPDKLFLLLLLLLFLLLLLLLLLLLVLLFYIARVQSWEIIFIMRERRGAAS
jgi:hypothetical protein